MPKKENIPTPADVLARGSRPTIARKESREFMAKRLRAAVANARTLPIRVHIPAEKYNSVAADALAAAYIARGWTVQTLEGNDLPMVWIILDKSP